MRNMAATGQCFLSLRADAEEKKNHNQKILGDQRKGSFHSGWMERAELQVGLSSVSSAGLSVLCGQQPVLLTALLAHVWLLPVLRPLTCLA